jgi:hypothetical protein
MVISWYLKGEWKASRGRTPPTAHNVYTHIHYKIIHQDLNISQLMALVFGSICHPITQDKSLCILQNGKSNAVAYIMIRARPVGFSLKTIWSINPSVIYTHHMSRYYYYYQ